MIRSYQLLKFNDSDERDSFIVRAKTFFQSSSIPYIESEVSYSQLMGQANTKEMRDDLLKRFFKTALAAVNIVFFTCASFSSLLLCEELLGPSTN